MQCKNIPDRDVLEFICAQGDRWCTHGDGYSMPTVQDAMPAGTPVKVQRAKMGGLIRRGLVDGCACGCRGDYAITAKGLAEIKKERHENQPPATAQGPGSTTRGVSEDVTRAFGPVLSPLIKRAREALHEEAIKIAEAGKKMIPVNDGSVPRWEPSISERCTRCWTGHIDDGVCSRCGPRPGKGGS